MNKKNLWLSSAFILSGFVHAQVMTSPPSYSVDQKNPMDIFRAEAERTNNLVHTKLDLKFDYNKMQVLGEEWVTLKPHFYSTNNVILDAKAMIIHEVALVIGNSKKKLNYKYDDLKLNINLGKEYKKDEEYTLYIKYTARPEEVKQKGSNAINDAKGVYFINAKGEKPNYPTQIWTQGETEASSCWFPTIDRPNQKSSEEITLTYPDKYVSLSNGLLKSSKKNSDGTKTDYWKFDNKHAPYLFFFGIGEYSVVKDKWKNIDVEYYVEPAYKDVARQIFGHTPEMIQFFSDLLKYPYPWQKYSQMTAREYVSGAMENTTATLFNDGVQRKAGRLIDNNDSETIIAHELFHHWFGDLVTAESWGNLTVNESFANYSEYLWLEHKYGKEKADEHRFNEISGYEQNGGPTKNLVRVHYNTHEDMFDGVSYNKGGLILHMLRNFLGDDAFFKGLSKYLKDHEFGKAEAVELRLSLEEVSGRDLNWFFNQWYFDNDHPKLTTVSEYNPTTKKVKVTIKQDPNKLFEFPFAIDIVENGKANRQQVWITKTDSNVFEFDASKKPDVVIPNADQVLLADINDKKPIEEFIAQYKAGKGNYFTRILAINAIADAQATNPKAADALIDALNDPYEGLRIHTIKKLDLKSKSIADKSIKKLKQLASNDPITLVQAAALKALNNLNIYDAVIFEKASKSPSFSVQAEGLVGVFKNNPSKIEQTYKSIDDDIVKNSASLSTILAPIWIKNNEVNKAHLISEAAAVYQLINTDDPKVNKVFEDGLNWIMTTDSPVATAEFSNTLTKYYSHFKKVNPQVAAVLRNNAEKALQLKKNLASSKKSPSISRQVEDLQKAFNSMQ